MFKLKKIIQAIVEHYQLIVIDTYEEERMVNRVDYLNQGLIPDANTLYICQNPGQLTDPVIIRKLGQLTEPPLILSQAQEETMLPIIKLNRMIPSGELFAFITDFLKSESLIQQEINDLYHLLYSGVGLDEIARQAESFIHRPISVLDASYGIMALSPLMHEMTYGLDRVDNGIFLSLQEIESLRRLQIEHQIYKNNRAFLIKTEDHPDNDWIFCAIRIQHVMSGYIAIAMPHDTPDCRHELTIAGALADICAIEMQKHEFMLQRTGLQYETFLIELIEGKYTDLNLIESRFKILNHKLGNFFCMIMFYCPEPHNSELFNRQQMASLRKKYPNSMSVVYKNNIILLINQDTSVRLDQNLTDTLYNFCSHNQLKAIISQPFADILKIPVFYQQVQGTLALFDPRGSDQMLFYSTEALPSYLFSKCEYKELEIGIHYHIFQLRDYDETYHTDFIPTLRAYLENNRNATQTAQALHIHRSTFFYRAKKIEEILGIELTDSRLLFLYDLSFRIWDYLSR